MGKEACRTLDLYFILMEECCHGQNGPTWAESRWKIHRKQKLSGELRPSVYKNRHCCHCTSQLTINSGIAPVKVFGSARFTNVARVLVCLEEVGADYEVVDIDFPTKEHKKPEHHARNPFGEIPAFQDGDLVLFESRAIAKYILRKYRTDEVDMLREGSPEEAAMVDVWTEVEAHQYNKALAPIVMECLIYPTAYGKPTNQTVVDESVAKLRGVLEVYEARLSEHEYLAGSFLSFADLSHFAFTCRFMETPYASLFDSFPSVKVWWERLASRPSSRKVGAGLSRKV